MAESLETAGVGVTVIHVSTVKPLDRRQIEDFVRLCPNVVTVEEHQLTGGLGSAIAELLVDLDASLGLSFRLKRIALDDKFPDDYGSQQYLLAQNRLDAEGILGEVQAFWAQEPATLGELLNIVTPLHQKTTRNHLARMVDDKVSCMAEAKNMESIIGMVIGDLVMEDINISLITGSP